MASMVAQGYVQLRVDQQTLTNDMNRARGITETGLAGMTRSFQSAGQTMAGTLGAIMTSRALLWLAGQAREVASSFIYASAQFEQFEIALGALTGSAERGTRMLADLKKMALETPFQLTDLLKGTQRLLALGFTADEVIPTLKSLGDVASAMPEGAAEGLNRVILALGQMKGKGKVMGEEMRQLNEAGIPAWDALAKRIGTNVPNAMEMVKKGSVSARTGIAAILDLSQDPRFFGMMIKQSKTFMGVMSNLHDLLWQMSAEIGTDLFTAVKDSVVALVGFLQSDAGKQLTGTFKSILGSITAAVRPIGPILLAAAPAVLAIGAALGTVALIAPAVVTGLSAISGAVGFLFTPMGAIVGIGAALGGALVAVDQFRQGFMSSWGLIASAGGELVGFLQTTWGEFFNVVQGFITSNGETFRTWGALIAEVAAGTIRTTTLILQQFVAWAKELWNEYGDTVSALWYLLSDAVTTVLEEISFGLNNFGTLAELVWTQIGLSAVEMVDQISGAFWGLVAMANGVASAIEATFGGMWDNLIAAFRGEGMRDVGSAAAEAFAAGFDEIARSHWLGASELQEQLRKERDALLAERDRAKGLAARDRRKRLAPLPAGAEGAGAEPGAPAMPKPPLDPETIAVKFAFTKFDDLWKKVQESLTGGGVQELARRTATAAEGTRRGVDVVADEVRAATRAIKRIEPGLA
jgi:tape measure domain-containing protein